MVEATVSDTVEFVDPGGNFERVLCPACNTEITRWWVGAMEAAYESRFENLMITLPCCGTSSSLNDLQYDWPAGFARFVLEVRNANIGGILPANEVAELEALLGCAVKQVLAHY